jgi:4-amino-4-deoxy-L-arabinose transferase-like glycosyltransferase
LQRVEALTGDSGHNGDGIQRWPCLDAAALFGLFVFHAVSNWQWVATNVTLMGWDRSSHLAKTLIYNDMLREINLRTLFTALTWPWNRPPLPFLTVVPFYRLFGISTDVALMSNCLYLAILLISVYGIGHKLFGRGVGLLAAFLVSFYPVLFSISRLSYVDYAMTAMVALGIYLLVKTDRFRNRRWSLLFGLGMGLGLLIKWPYIAFAGAPIAYVACHSGALKKVLFVPWGGREGSARLRSVVTSPWLHVLLGLLLTALWYIPNWDRLPGFMLGYLLPLISWALLTCTFYVLSRRPGQGTNLLSALLIGATLASAWSLPNIAFSGRFVFVAYGGVNIQGKGLSFLNPTFYARYLSTLLTEQLSPLYFVALIVALAVLVWASYERSSTLALWRQMDERDWILALWLTVPFLIFTLSQTWNSRFNIALLPAAALITARGFLAVRTRWTKLALISLLVICGVAQFCILSYDSLYPITQRTVVSLPVVGRLNLLGEGAYIMPPSTDRMDSRYWVAPEILSQASRGGEGPKSLALLVNYTYLNADILRYLALLQFPDIEIRDLSRDEGGSLVFVNTFAADYVVLSTHDPYKLSDGARETVGRIFESPQVFEQVFELKAEFELPDGETVFLYGKRLPPAAQEVQEYYQHLVAGLDQVITEGGAVVLDPPTEVATFALFYGGQAPVYLLPTGDAAADAKALEEIVGTHDTVYAIFRSEGEYDPQAVVEGWLSDNADRSSEEWYGDVRLVVFATADGKSTPSELSPLHMDMGRQVSLVGFESLGEMVGSNQAMGLPLQWGALSRPDEGSVFLTMTGVVPSETSTDGGTIG